MSSMEEDWKAIAEDSVVLPWHRVKEILKQAKAEAWDEAVNEARARLMVMSMDEDELKAANPYRKE